MVTTTTRILLALSMMTVCGDGFALADLTDEDIKAAARRAPAADARREAEVAQRDMEVQQRLERTIDRCVATVKEDLPDGKLDAYVQNGVLHSYGTQEARFKLDRCIVESGYPLSPLEK